MKRTPIKFSQNAKPVIAAKQEIENLITNTMITIHMKVLFLKNKSKTLIFWRMLIARQIHYGNLDDTIASH